MTTVGALRESLRRSWWRRALCAVVVRHRWREDRGPVRLRGFRPMRLIVCRCCGKSWAVQP